MAFEPVVAVYDACVLYPFHLRNLLVQCAVDRLVEARWTNEIHEEWIRNLSVNNPAIPASHLHAARDLMNAAVPNAIVRGYEAAVPSVVLPDVNDRHVVAAAVAARASLIITWNVRDFPADALRKYGLQKQTPDLFPARLYDHIPHLMIADVAGARRNLRRSKVALLEFLRALRRQRLVRFTTKIESHLSGL
jgi:hypothetical protein